MKIYVASSWKNAHQPAVVELLRSLGHDVYDFRNPPNKSGFGWEQVSPHWKANGGIVGVQSYRDMLAHDIAKAGYEADMKALRECDACVYVLPCGKSASWEFGYAMGQSKPCFVLWLGVHEPELMFMEATVLGSMKTLEAAFSCKRCGKGLADVSQVFCGAECTARWEAGDRPERPKASHRRRALPGTDPGDGGRESQGEEHVSYAAKILADSISPDSIRLTTMEVTFPRIVLAEFNTHRVFSRNSASSRAIPVEKMLQRVQEDPFLPVWWGKNQSGMQAAEELVDRVVENPSMMPFIERCPRSAAHSEWLSARDHAVESVKMLQRIGLHKQIANRLLEPFLWHTVIVTATEWANFFALRCNKDAQPEIRFIAEMMKKLYDEGQPKKRAYGEWHLPLVSDEERAEWSGTQHPLYAPQVCAGRCARVSYLTHDGRRDPQADYDLACKLQKAGHMSPFEHAARPFIYAQSFSGNFRGWQQFRKLLPHEDVFQPEES